MKKIQFIILFFIAAIPLLFSCEDKSTAVEEMNKILAIVEVQSRPSYFDPDSNRIIYEENMFFSGELISESITNIVSISIGENIYEPQDDYSIDRKNYGLLRFNSDPYTIFENFNNVELKIETTIGNINGLIQIPDSIQNIKFNYTSDDTISFNDKFNIHFEGNADYYILNYWITYLSDDSLNTYHAPGELISRNPYFVLDSLQLNREGKLAINSIATYNGPYLEEGSAGNMKGDGTGFLYCIRRQPIYSYFTLIK